MGNFNCCFKDTSPRRVKNHHERNQSKYIEKYQIADTFLSLAANESISKGSNSGLQHISEREPDDITMDPSLHPRTGTMFLTRSITVEDASGENNRRQSSLYYTLPTKNTKPTIKRHSSCSSIYIDDSTVSQPNLKQTIKCVALALYYHIKKRELDSSEMMNIFDEKRHPLTRDPVPYDYYLIEPEHRHIYRFIRTLFSAAQLTAECAIITLVYIERLMHYAEVDVSPNNWKRVLLGAIMLASKVWDDQAVWNVDYCQILKDVPVEDMNELERRFLELLQFNINVPASVYAKYYFDLRSLAVSNQLSTPAQALDVDRARDLEASSSIVGKRVIVQRCNSVDASKMAPPVFVLS